MPDSCVLPTAVVLCNQEPAPDRGVHWDSLNAAILGGLKIKPAI